VSSHLLSGRTALVTGGTRGIGRAISLELACAGATVLANYVRDVKSADELERLAEGEGLRLRTCRADLTSKVGHERLAEALSALGAPLSVLVHAAATGVHRPFDELTLRHFDWTFALNVRAFFDLVHRLLPTFGPAASIVAISSAGGRRAAPYYTLIGSSKGALEAMVRHLAVELAPRGIRVNCVVPGTVLTDAWKTLPDAEARLAEAVRRSPRGRLTTVEEVATAVQFLCSDASSGIVGHTLVVDCGYELVE
jgi:enoyl-[acyl-carrier protein] reductase III